MHLLRAITLPTGLTMTLGCGRPIDPPLPKQLNDREDPAATDLSPAPRPPIAREEA